MLLKSNEALPFFVCTPFNYCKSTQKKSSPFTAFFSNTARLTDAVSLV